jgi:hypothetical protein
MNHERLCEVRRARCNVEQGLAGAVPPTPNGAQSE